jgi:nucleoside-diphosphate-sugar epimerase
VHRSDAARLAHLAVEAAPAGSVLHAVADEGVPFREIAQRIGRHLGLPTASVAPIDAVEHFAHLGHFVALDSPASAAVTRDLLAWQPTGPSLLEDLEQGHYYREA